MPPSLNCLTTLSHTHTHTHTHTQIHTRKQTKTLNSPAALVSSACCPQILEHTHTQALTLLTTYTRACSSRVQHSLPPSLKAYPPTHNNTHTNAHVHSRKRAHTHTYTHVNTHKQALAALASGASRPPSRTSPNDGAQLPANTTNTTSAALTGGAPPIQGAPGQWLTCLFACMCFCVRVCVCMCVLCVCVCASCLHCNLKWGSIVASSGGAL